MVVVGRIPTHSVILVSAMILTREREISMMATIFFDKANVSAVVRIIGILLLVVVVLVLSKLLFIALAIGASCAMVCKVFGKSSGARSIWNADSLVNFFDFRLSMAP